MKKGVLLASGGIDSMVLAYQLKKQKALDSIVFIEYGQASSEEQWRCVQHHAGVLKVQAQHVRAFLPEFMQGSGAILSGKQKKKQKDPYEVMKLRGKKYDAWLRDVWDYIPGRNTFFLLYACGWARHRKLDRVYTGFQFDEPEWRAMHRAMSYEGDLDTYPGFLWAFNDLLEAGAFTGKMEVIAPFLDAQKDKSAIVALGRKLGVDLSQTYSCEFWPACGSCRGCLVKRKVLDIGTK